MNGIYRVAPGPADDELVMCPSCATPVEGNRDGTATCLRCDSHFSTRKAMTLVEARTARALAKCLDRQLEKPSRSAALPWALTAGVIGVWVGATVMFGQLGLLITLCAFWALFAFRVRVDPYR